MASTRVPLAPAWARQIAKWDPMKPIPPVTSTLAPWKRSAIGLGRKGHLLHAFIDRLSYRSDVGFREPDIKWQRQDFASQAFGDRQRTRSVSQIFVRRLAMNRDSIVNQRGNTFRLKMVSKPIAIGMADHVKMVDMAHVGLAGAVHG